MRARLPGLAVLLLAPLALGWNPLEFREGPPLRWGTAVPVVWNPDGGPMGSLDNADATNMVVDGFAVWEAVPTAKITFMRGLQIVGGNGLPVDVTAANYAEIINLDNGQNPVIYDNDQEIWEALGVSTSVLGFAGVLRSAGSTATKGYVVLQGDWIDGVEIRPPNCGSSRCDPELPLVEQFLNIVVHEVGRFVGLGHTSVNHESGSIAGCPEPFIDEYATMSPLAHFSMESLHHDDRIGLSALYPTAVFSTDFAEISGRLLDRDGTTPFDGANVVLRPDTADCDLLYNSAQAMQSGVNPAENGGAGTYRFPGLNPATGYTLFVTQIADGGGYSIGGTSPPALGGPPEFFNGLDEGHFDPPDDPVDVFALGTGPGGSALADRNLRINNPGGPGAALGSGADGLRLGKTGTGTILLSWGAACNAAAVPDQTFAVYEGTLAAIDGVQDHQPLTCGTGNASSFEAPAVGGDRYYLIAPLLAEREGGLGTGSAGQPRTPLTSCAPVAPDSCP